MKLDFMRISAEWNPPVFKVLAHNDTGAAVGNQAGVLIPKSLRKYFPSLEGAPSSLQPTIDKRLKAQLFVEEKFVGTVSTRYQFQTRTGKRTPESRITDELGPMRNSAEGGDILIFQRAASGDQLYRLILVRKTSPAYKTVAAGIGTRRWGVLTSST
jgi:putative restriction endonuclease